MTDLLVVGGGIVGLSVAVHAARYGKAVVLTDAGPLGGYSTQRSGALVRTHYADAASAELALRGLEHFEAFSERYGGPSGFTRTGFAYIPEADDDGFGARVDMLRGVGVDTSVIDPSELHAIDPSLFMDDVDRVAYEPRSGYADPALTCATLAAAAADAGASLLAHTPVSSLVEHGAVLDGGERIEAEHVVLCAGAFSVTLAAGVGVDLPIQPTAVKVALFDRAVDKHLTVIDAPNEVYFRPNGAGLTLVGRRTWGDEDLSSPDAPLPEVDQAYVDVVRDRLAARLPSAAGARVADSRSCVLDMTPDGLPLVGPSGVPGLWLCCGWSGTGFKTGPSVGEALAGWIASGVEPEVLSGFGLDREMQAPVGVRSPH